MNPEKFFFHDLSQFPIVTSKHGGAPDAGVAKWQRRIEPVWKRIGSNCHLTRPISDAYERAGFSVERQGAAYMPKTPRPFGWVEYGAARAAS